MPSRLSNQITFDEESFAPSSPIKAIRSSASPPPAKKQKMSLSQTYYIASSARTKLGKEACRPDHNLRLLVGHANLLDSLMIELRDAEREQEAWFNASVQRASKDDEPKHIQWADTIVRDEEEFDSDESDSDSDSEYDESDFEMALPLRRIRQAPVIVSSQEVEEDEEELGYADLEDSSDLALTRTTSHPPELMDDSDSEMEDVSPPTTPPSAVLEFSEKDNILNIASSKGNYAGDFQLIPQSHAPLIEAF